MKHIITIISIIILITSNAFSQVIKGTIKDKETNKPLPGVNIALVKKKTTGTITDLNGEYSLSVPEGINMLEFRFIGYETIKKTFQLGSGDTITFDTTFTEEAELAIDYMCLFIPSMSYIDFVKEFYQSDGIFFFNNNYLKYYKQDGYDELTMGIHFQPEITKRLSPAFTIEGMCDLRAISMQNHNTENNLNVKPHFRLKYQTYSFDFKIGYNKAIERQEMPDQLYGLDHYYFSEVNDGFSITYNNIFKSSIWLDCIDNNIFDNKWNKDALWGWNLSKTIRADNFLRNMRFYADVLVANHSYVADNNQKFVHNLESGMYGVVVNILNYPTSIEWCTDESFAPEKLTTIFYEIKYAQSHFFDNDAILDHKSGNGILNKLRMKFAQNFYLDMGHFYAKNYASTYSNQVYNCYATAKPEISVLSLGASYQKWTGKYHGNFYCGLSAYARIYQDFINSQFSYTVGANLVLVPAIRFSR